MPTRVALTNAGAQGLMTSGVPLSGYLQIGRDTLPAADWPTAVAVPGAFRVKPISRAIVATQTIIQALDDEDTEEYDDLASIGFWTADPSTPGAELWALGTAAPGEVLSIKTLNNDLIWTVSLMLTPTQVGNLSFDISIETVPEASETRFGITRYATDTEAQAIEANASDERTATIASLWTWWNALGILASKVPNLDAGKIATGVLTAARIPNLDADKIATGVLTALRIPNLDAGKIATGVFAATRIPASIARLASPNFTGQPTAPTPSTANNSTRVATTAHVYAVRDELVNGAPGALDTINELATALGDDPNFRTTILNLIAERGTRTGAIVACGGAAAPSGYLLCDGREVSRATYSALFAAIGEVWGVGDGATTFNLPDLQGRVLAGAGPGLGTGLDSVGETGGSATHTLTTNEIPAHSHTFEGQHGGTRTNGVDPSLGDENNTETVTTTEVGGGQAHNNVQPTAVVNWVIKT